MLKYNDKVIIRHVTNAVPAGNLAVITGDGFKNARVFANKLGASSDIIKAALKAGKNIKDMNFASGADIELEVIKNSDNHVLTVKTPEGAFSGWQIVIKSEDGESVPFNMNVPEYKWIQNDIITAGGEIRIFGHCFAAPDCFDLSGEEVHGYGKMLTSGHGVSVFLRDSKDCIYDLEVKAASCYEVSAAVPQTAA